MIADRVRAFFAAFLRADRAAFEEMLTDDFTFTSPYDDHIDRAAYFETCWPSAGTFVHHDIDQSVAEGDTCFVVYWGQARNGSRFRNTELFRLDGDRVRSVEVFFGRPADS